MGPVAGPPSRPTVAQADGPRSTGRLSRRTPRSFAAGTNPLPWTDRGCCRREPLLRQVRHRDEGYPPAGPNPRCAAPLWVAAASVGRRPPAPRVLPPLQLKHRGSAAPPCRPRRWRRASAHHVSAAPWRAPVGRGPAGPASAASPMASMAASWWRRSGRGGRRARHRQLRRSRGRAGARAEGLRSSIRRARCRSGSIAPARGLQR
mmetsp:Transcript_12680/g.44860  ORF Transcript_12680/g.44860 Transcript_12680/m.44860 type:complete len:205 (+) Transcript_12680:2614-3228(+)